MGWVGGLRHRVCIPQSTDAGVPEADLFYQKHRWLSLECLSDSGKILGSSRAIKNLFFQSAGQRREVSMHLMRNEMHAYLIEIISSISCSAV